ncbi:hypothetical protein [Streptomyces sp. NPDC004250]|uniref:hypothetical protein n=1 Tax=Streptomyces sp. NPDC004250 TaxID=3364692 RepID=UPI0036C98E2C
MSTFARPFRVHLRHGQAYEGAQFPSGLVVVLEDPEYGLVVSAADVDALLRGYGGGHLEWPDPSTSTEP